MHIPIDSEIRNDPRFRKLAKSLNSEAEALLLCFSAWALARRYWQAEHSYIPFHVWDAGDFGPLEDVKLAERREDGVYCRGTVDSFDWYHDWKADKSTAGKASAAVRKAKYGTAQPPKKPRTDIEQNSNTLEQPRTASNVIVTVTDTVKEEDKESNPPAPQSSPPPPPPHPFDLELAEEWAAFARTKSDTVKPDRLKYADAIRRMRTLGLSEAEIRSTLAWIKADDFWSRVAWSPTQLVKSKGGIRKLDNVRAQMRERPGALDDWDEWIAKVDGEAKK